MQPIIFSYRSKDLTEADIYHIRECISTHYNRGRSFISRVLCEDWQWIQPNGNLKECAARDLLLRLEEKGHVELPPRQRPKNNLKRTCYSQIPIYSKKAISGSLGKYSGFEIRPVENDDNYLWGYLLHHYHYLGLPKLVGEYLKYMVFLEGQPVACLLWASAAFKIKSRDEYIGWSIKTRKERLHFVTNNTRFLILPWVRVKNLASRVLSSNLKRLNHDWEKRYNHQIYLAETFVDISRFQGTCYKAANFEHIGQTKGSAKKGNSYQHHGHPKAIYVYPLQRNFRRMLNDQG